MRRRLLLWVVPAVLGAVVGCKSHGVCDCNVSPIYDGPLPPASDHSGPAHYTTPYHNLNTPANGSETINAMPH
jgi:hypothetical protein